LTIQKAPLPAGLFFVFISQNRQIVRFPIFLVSDMTISFSRRQKMLL